MNDEHPLYDRRRAGVVLHPTSLPGPLPRGLICHDAYRFVEFLKQSGMHVWQMLPMGPTHSDNSPYQSLSVHACDERFISLDWLVDRKLLDSYSDVKNFTEHKSCLSKAWLTFQKQKSSDLYRAYVTFQQENKYWLDDYAMFMAIREQYDGQPWTGWPEPLRERNTRALKEFGRAHTEETSFIRFCQFIVYEQWQALKRYASEHDVLLFGDLPIYVSHDSVDVWSHRELFLLDSDGQAKIVTGVPPDYFSETGQRWGNPQYDWQAMQQQGFKWWKERVETQLQWFDLIRIDHFRGFQAYWEISAEQETAIEGRWVEAPGEELLSTLINHFHRLPLVAEDLGIITSEVTALREQFHLPGMKILQFAFDGNPANEYLPHNHRFDSTVYTGTHDNDTTLSWYDSLAKTTQKQVYDYLGAALSDSMPWPLVRAALASTSCLSMLPMQDIMQLGEGHRMNTPGTVEDNWQWRFSWQDVAEDLSLKLGKLCQLYDR